MNPEEIQQQAFELGLISRQAVRSEIDQYLRASFYDHHIKYQVATHLADAESSNVLQDIIGSKLKFILDELKQARSMIELLHQESRVIKQQFNALREDHTKLRNAFVLHSMVGACKND